MKHWFLGWDARDDLAAQVAIRSALKTARNPGNIKVHFLKDHELRRAGIYWRAYEVRPNGQRIDIGDGKPFSTDFSFSRFAVPELARMMGIHEPVLFTDPDVMFRAPIEELFERYDEKYSVMCIPHDHTPKEMTKFDGIEQTRYFRKNWSSVMLMHPDKASGLTPQKVNNWPGAQLHALLWAVDSEIGTVEMSWNHLVGYDEPNSNAKLVHFTLGTPDVPGRENDEFAAEWRGYVEPGEMPVHFAADGQARIKAAIGGYKRGGP